MYSKFVIIWLVVFSDEYDKDATHVEKVFGPLSEDEAATMKDELLEQYGQRWSGAPKDAHNVFSIEALCKTD